MIDQSRWVIYLKLVGAAVIWGGTFIAGRLLAQEVGAFSAAFLRFAIASLVLVGLSYQNDRGLPPLQWPQWQLVLGLGLTGVFAYNVLFFLGLKTVPASRAALIVASNPIAIALLAAVIFQETLTRLKIMGIGLSLIGATIVISKGHPLSLLTAGFSQGDLFLLGGLACWAAYTLLGKQTVSILTPLAATTYTCLVGTIALFPLALTDGLLNHLGQYSATAWGSVAYLGILGTVIAFIWYSEGIQTIGAAKAAIFINLVPPSAILLAALILHEPITPTLVLGGSLVITGIICTNRG